jgi:L-fuculose-phosphate aldolase
MNSMLRAALVEAARSLDAAGFVPNKSGNVSGRTPRGFVITPAALPYAQMTPDDLVEIDAAGEPDPTARRPSSEWRMHAAIYAARPEVHAVVHTHSPRATALACARLGIPPFHYMIALAGGDVRCAPYATFGTESLATGAVAALADRRAALLANHGVIAAGATLQGALAVAREVENLAGQYLQLLAAGLQPVLLDEVELHRVVAKFADYGRPA